MTRRFTRTVAAIAASAALVTGVAATPAQAQPADLSSEAAAGNWAVLFSLPVLGSSMLSSLLGQPQCTLFDTTGC